MFNQFINSPRYIRRLITVFVDLLISVFSVWLAFSLRLETFISLNSQWWPLFVAIVPFTLAIYIRLGLYRALIRNFSLYAIRNITLASFIVVFLWGCFAFALGLQGFPRSIILITWLILFVLTFLSRFIMHSVLAIYQNRQAIYNVAIYDVDVNSHKIVELLTNDMMYRPVCFISDNADQYDKIDNLKVFPKEELPQLINKYNIRCVCLSDSLNKTYQRKKIFDFLGNHPIKVIYWSLAVSHIPNLQLLKDLTIEELMQREQAKPDIKLLEKGIKARNVLITGAGGSIGSKLCQHIADYLPNQLILLEQSEASLFEVCKELQQIYPNKQIPMHSYLGSVGDKTLLNKIIRQHQIDIIYHAAAYKHVPLVESNVIAGIHNNVVGTYTVAQCALENKVRHFVLISTDKAVNPINIMGVSKRITEKLMQLFANKSSDTCFCAVRFGNVLGSSGSVVPIFREQIEKGLPLTITHKDMDRYFMSIDEAVDLVIQAGSLAKSGDIFLLDMGKPIKILDIAKRMIHLSGLHIKKDNDDSSDSNTVEIKYTGLRDGEKLSELLYAGTNPKNTSHPKIMLLNEAVPDIANFESMLNQLETMLKSYDTEKLLSLLEDIIVDFGDPHPNLSNKSNT